MLRRFAAQHTHQLPQLIQYISNLINYPIVLTILDKYSNIIDVGDVCLQKGGFE